MKNKRNKRWSAEDDQLLREAVAAGYSSQETATLLGRTKEAIYTRKSGLGIEPRFPFIRDEKEKEKEPIRGSIEFSALTLSSQVKLKFDLLSGDREKVAEKWGVSLKSIQQFPDRMSLDTKEGRIALAKMGMDLLGNAKEVATVIGCSERSIHRWLKGTKTFVSRVRKATSEAVEVFKRVTKEEPETPANSSALIVRDIVLALKPYGVNCSFEFEGETIKKMVANWG
jgi:hypothetical protein